MLKRSIEEAITVISSLQEEETLQFLHRVTLAMIDSFNKGGTLLIAGNGGS